MVFRWDPAKAKANLRKHRVSFEEASSVMGDPLATTFPDDEHSHHERRFVTVGMSSKDRILVVVHAEHREAIRIISARRATRREQDFYENG